MNRSRLDNENTPGPEGMTFEVTLKVLGVSTIYAATLSYLERHYPIKPDHIWAEVAGGVLISLVPVALTARKTQQVDWRLYEGAIWRSFIAAGTPIILWQIGEAMLRQMELLRYTTARELKSAKAYVHDTTPLAERGGERARGGNEVC
ncbi:hypothetical protein [Candidatus Viridilinea mediisalina]|uniref:hypothetical protein n=1 Tax=Candidatus Viridilinea mediisalina TaxID=2024553 RepID=UPI000F593B50|nr:hypothetical protein [Candidatus Viridilinea mediisalina]